MKNRLFLSAVIFYFSAFVIHAQSVISVGGTFAGNQVWEADTVKVVGNVVISGSLVIRSAAKVEFQGNHSIETHGLKVIGTEDKKVLVTINDTLGFSDPSAGSGGWGGITDYGTSSGDSSVLQYCRFEYGKRISDPYTYFRGLVKFGDNTDKVIIDHCIFKNSYAKDGAIIKSDRLTRLDSSTVTGNYSTAISLRMGDITNCTITGNTGDGIYIWEKEYLISGNTVTGNTGYGLFLYKSKKASVLNNSISGNNRGVRLFEVITAEFSGETADTTICQADTVKIASDVAFGSKLVIKPGTCMEFQGHYSLAAGILEAVGAPGDSITFTVHDTTGFSNPAIEDGGWKKISGYYRADFNYCRILFGKNIDNSGVRAWEKESLIGGPLRINNSRISNNYSITMFNKSEDNHPYFLNCLFENNRFSLNLGVFDHSPVTISKCRFYNNSCNFRNADINESHFEMNNSLGFYLDDDNSMHIKDCAFIKNNSIVIDQNYHYDFILRNCIISENDNLSINIQTNLSRMEGNLIYNNRLAGSLAFNDCLIVNNTFYNNTAENDPDPLPLIVIGEYGVGFYNNIVYGNKSNYKEGIQISIANGGRSGFFNNLIENELEIIEYNDASTVIFKNNLDAEPFFIKPEEGDFSLASNSPCIDMGDSLILDDAYFMPLYYYTDVYGNPRIAGANIDMGACEFQGTPANRPPFIERISDQKILPGKTRQIHVRFFDMDPNDTCKLLSISSDTSAIAIHDVLSGEDSVLFIIAPEAGWTGSGRIQIRVADNNGDTAIREFRVIVSTDVCGQLKENTTWNYDTITVTCNVTVPAWITLTINPGTVVNFSPGASLTVRGSIIASGDESSGITFTCADTSGLYNNTHTGWNGITIEQDCPLAEFRYCNFRFARSVHNGSALNVASDNVKTIISHCSFQDNYSDDHGGALYVGSSPTEFNNNIFRNNRAEGFGGAVYNERISMDITNSLFCNNSAYQGAAVSATFGTTRLVNSTVTGNTTDTCGSGILLYDGDIINCIISDNQSLKGGKQVQNETPCNFVNSLLKGGKDIIAHQDNIGEYTEITDADPRFLDTLNPDFHLSPFSPCINAGTADTAGLHLPLSDLGGNPRILYGVIDMGAYEYRQKECIIVTQPLSHRVCEGTEVSFVTDATGDILKCQWQKNGLNIPGEDQYVLNFDSIASGDTGLYNCLFITPFDVKSTDTVKLSIVTPLKIETQTASLSLCAGEDTTLFVYASGGDSLWYRWYRVADMIPDQEASHLFLPGQDNTVTADYYCTVNNHCGSLASDTITVTVIPLPDPQLPADTTITENDTLILDAGSGYQQYLWSTGSEDQTIRIFGLTPGSYSYDVRVTNDHGCNGYDTTDVRVTKGIFLIPLPGELTFEIYPVPGKDIIYLRPGSDYLNEVIIKIADITGRIVQEMKIERLFQSVAHPVDISGLPDGSYYLSISNKEFLKVERIVKMSER